MTILNGNKSLSATSVFFILITFILGSLFFLRLGFSVGMLGFTGTILLIICGSFIIIPSSLAFAEMASNQKVEGEGHYFMISRTYGLTIGAVLGIILYLIQTICIAFYLIAFTEAFTPLLHLIKMDGVWGRPLICVPAFFILIYYSHKKGSIFQIKYIIIVVLVLLVSLLFFLMGDSEAEELFGVEIFSIRFGNLSESFTSVFSIMFPAFACVITGIGLNRPGRRTSKSITNAILAAILFGLIIYCIAAFKLAKSALTSELIDDQFVMGRIAMFGKILIPATVAISSLIASSVFIELAPSTLKYLAIDGSLPLKGLNHLFTPEKGKPARIINAYSITYIVAFFFMLKGELDYTSEFLTVLYLLLFAGICLCSFLNDFGADPSYRPSFRSHWYISLIGFLVSAILMFLSNPFYAFLAVVIIFIVYFIIRPVHGKKRDLSNLVQGALFQLNRHIQVYFQNKLKDDLLQRWNPNVVCVTPITFENDKALRLMKWICFRFGYGSYVHHIEGNIRDYSGQYLKEIKEKLQHLAGSNSKVYLSTIVSPSFQNAVSQLIQIPVVPGKSNNLVLSVFEKGNTDSFHKLSESVSLAEAAQCDSCILIPSERNISYLNGIHIWLDSSELRNSELMLNLTYIIMAFPDWKDSQIRVFDVVNRGETELEKIKLSEMVLKGQLPFSVQNVEIFEKDENTDVVTLIIEKSKSSGLVLMSFNNEILKNHRLNIERFNDFGDILYLKATDMK